MRRAPGSTSSRRSPSTASSARHARSRSTCSPSARRRRWAVIAKARGPTTPARSRSARPTATFPSRPRPARSSRSSTRSVILKYFRLVDARLELVSGREVERGRAFDSDQGHRSFDYFFARGDYAGDQDEGGERGDGGGAKDAGVFHVDS